MAIALCSSCRRMQPRPSPFLTALVVLAAGITGLQVSANPYVTNLGPQAPRQPLNLAQAFNSFAPFIGPFFGGALILGALQAHPSSSSLLRLDAPDLREQQASSVRLPYLASPSLSSAWPSHRPHKLPPTDFTATSAPGELPGQRPRQSDPSQSPHGALAIFVYVAPRSPSAASSSTTSAFPKSAGLKPENRRQSGPPYWAEPWSGAFIGSGVLRLVSAGKALGRRSVYRLLLSLITNDEHRPLAIGSVILVGSSTPSCFLPSSPSALRAWANSPARLKPHGRPRRRNSHSSRRSHLADRIGVQNAFIIPRSATSTCNLRHHRLPSQRHQPRGPRHVAAA